MTSPMSRTEFIVKELAALSGVMKDDIHVSDDTVTTYISNDQLRRAKELEDIEVKIIEEHEYEYLISAK